MLVLVLRSPLSAMEFLLDLLASLAGVTVNKAKMADKAF